MKMMMVTNHLFRHIYLQANLMDKKANYGVRKYEKGQTKQAGQPRHNMQYHNKKLEANCSSVMAVQGCSSTT